MMNDKEKQNILTFKNLEPEKQAFKKNEWKVKKKFFVLPYVKVK